MMKRILRNFFLLIVLSLLLIQPLLAAKGMQQSVSLEMEHLHLHAIYGSLGYSVQQSHDLAHKHGVNIERLHQHDCYCVYSLIPPDKTINSSFTLLNHSPALSVNRLFNPVLPIDLPPPKS